jgi:hypothetical protein
MFLRNSKMADYKMYLWKIDAHGGRIEMTNICGTINTCEHFTQRRDSKFQKTTFGQKVIFGHKS